MSTINDLALNERCIEIRALSEKLAFYMREGRVAELENALGQIHSASMKAVYRLNDLRYTRNPY